MLLDHVHLTVRYIIVKIISMRTKKSVTENKDTRSFDSLNLTYYKSIKTVVHNFFFNRKLKLTIVYAHNDGDLLINVSHTKKHELPT